MNSGQLAPIDSIAEIDRIARAVSARPDDAPVDFEATEIAASYLVIAAQKISETYEQCIQALDKIEAELKRDGILLAKPFVAPVE